MKKNLGSIHRFIRFLLAVFFAYLFIGDKATGEWKWICLALSVLYLITAITGYAPFYHLIGRSTRRGDN